MISISPLTDSRLITLAVQAPNNLPWAWQDGEDPWAFVPSYEGNIFIGAWVDGDYAGWALVDHLSPIRAEVHCCYLPNAYGHTQAIGNLTLGWIRDNTSYTHLRAPVVIHNALVIQMLSGIGFKKSHIEPDAFLKTGNFHHHLIMHYQYNINE